MSYWVDQPTKANLNHSKEIWRNDQFVAYEWQGRIEMVLDGYSIGHLIGGHAVLQRKYKGDFEKWIKDLRDKDDEKTLRIRENCRETLEVCEFIDDLWRRAGSESSG